MKNLVSALACLGALSAASSAVGQPSGAIARCGASTGQGYFFKDSLLNPGGPAWSEDGVRDGKIVLTKLNEEWDIQFDDVAGTFSYRQHGATVIPLGQTDERLTIGAFRGTYSDVYTFDFSESAVLWTSHKISAGVPKVAIYRAECSLMKSVN